MKLEFSRQILEKYRNFNFSDKFIPLEPSCSMRKGHKNMTNLTAHFQNSAQAREI